MKSLVIIMVDNWLSTDEMIAEVCDQAVKEYGGSNVLAIRCPDAEIEAKVRKYLNGKRGGKTIDTYVAGINDSVKIAYGTGKVPRKKGHTPDEDEDQGEDTPDAVDEPEAAEDTPAEEGDGYEGLF